MPWPVKWSDDRIEILKRMYAEGQSCSCIAAELGGVSRNAVIGKVHRLGLPQRKTVQIREGGIAREVFGTRTNRPANVRKHNKNYSVMQKFCGNPELIGQSEVDAEVRAEFYATEAVSLTDEQRAKAVKLLELQKHHCKWPYGDPRKPDFVFCGCDRTHGSPYCRPHTRIATGAG